MYDIKNSQFCVQFSPSLKIQKNCKFFETDFNYNYEIRNSKLEGYISKIVIRNIVEGIRWCEAKRT